MINTTNYTWIVLVLSAKPSSCKAEIYIGRPGTTSASSSVASVKPVIKKVGI